MWLKISPTWRYRLRHLQAQILESDFKFQTQFQCHGALATHHEWWRYYIFHPTVLNWDVQHIPRPTWDKQQQVPLRKPWTSIFQTNTFCVLMYFMQSRKMFKLFHFNSSPSWSLWNSTNRLHHSWIGLIVWFSNSFASTCSLENLTSQTKWREESSLEALSSWKLKSGSSTISLINCKTVLTPEIFFKSILLKYSWFTIC